MGKRKVRKFKKPANYPKKPTTAYFLFLQVNRESIKEEVGLSGKEQILAVCKLAGQKWREADDSVKAPFLEQATKNRMEYTKVLEEYKQTEEYTQWVKDVKEAKKAAKKPKSKKKKRKKKKAAKKRGRPKKTAKRGRGRPKKVQESEEEETETLEDSDW